MIYLLFGEDKYGRDRFYSGLKEKLGFVNDSINLTFHRNTFEVGKIILEASSLPFLSDRRMIVLEGVFKSKDKNFLDTFATWLENVPDFTDIVIIDNDTPDKRLKIYKNISKFGEIHEFKPMSVADIVSYIKKRVLEKSGTIDELTARNLQFACGTDLNSVNNEIDKLIAYNPNISTINVDLLVDAGYFNRIFDLTDAISSKNSKKALYHLEKLLSIGEEPLGILGMIGGQVRNLLLVRDLHEHRLNEFEIQSRTKLHQFVVQKSLGQIRYFTMPQLLTMHEAVLKTDSMIKQGFGDPTTLLERLVIRLSKKEA
ncbi:MAG: DNA polymerase III subunit delta [bacterium]